MIAICTFLFLNLNYNLNCHFYQLFRGDDFLHPLISYINCTNDFLDYTIIPIHPDYFIGKDFSECSEMLYQHHVEQWYWPHVSGDIICAGNIIVINQGSIEIWESITFKLDGRIITEVDTPFGKPHKKMAISPIQLLGYLNRYKQAIKERRIAKTRPMWWMVDVRLINHMSRKSCGTSIIWEFRKK